MLNTVCILLYGYVWSMNPSLCSRGQAGHRKGDFLGKDDSCDSTLAIYLNYVSTVCIW